MKKTIWGNTIVKNEGRFIWFAIMSIINHLDKMLIWDTGSSDDTVSIIKLLQKKYPQKIIFDDMGTVDAAGLTKLRQKMLEETKSDWLLILDGDEVWWESSIEKIINTIKRGKDELYAIVNPVINVVGDIYHYQEKAAGQYQILGRKGHLNIRAINRKIPGLHIKGDYPLEGFYDQNRKLIQQYNRRHLKFMNTPYLHFTYLNRSSNLTDLKVLGRNKKAKLELGIPFPKDFKYPEVLYIDRPKMVPSPWVKMSMGYKLKAAMVTPLKKLKRRLF